MIVTEMYDGQGLGNQLWCYVTTRVIAKDHKYAFGIMSPDKLKSGPFMTLDFGEPVIGGTGPEGGPPRTLPQGITHYYNERKIMHPRNRVDIRTYDPNIVNVPDNSKIDGIMQDEQYILHRRDEIREWLAVKQGYECFDYSSDDVCVINFRGGEYTTIPSVFLPKQYWNDAIAYVRSVYPNLRFVVITDDVASAKAFFPKFDVFHFNIAKDYVILKNARYLILSNSSFAFFPTWLNANLKLCIAPKYWSQYNTSDGFWGCSYNITSGWMYLDREGRLNDYETCRRELQQYMSDHPDYFPPPNPSPNYRFTPTKAVPSLFGARIRSLLQRIVQ